MKIISRPRGSGKTTELIKISARTGFPIVCRDYDEAARIFHVAQSLGKNIPHPITMKDISSADTFNTIKNKGFLIDELFSVIAPLFRGIPIWAVSFSPDKTVKTKAKSGIFNGYHTTRDYCDNCGCCLGISKRINKKGTYGCRELDLVAQGLTTKQARCIIGRELREEQ